MALNQVKLAKNRAKELPGLLCASLRYRGERDCVHQIFTARIGCSIYRHGHFLFNHHCFDRRDLAAFCYATRNRSLAVGERRLFQFAATGVRRILESKPGGTTSRLGNDPCHLSTWLRQHGVNKERVMSCRPPVYSLLITPFCEICDRTYSAHCHDLRESFKTRSCKFVKFVSEICPKPE